MILPYPPTVNHYWKRNRNGTLRVGERGVAFRLEVALRCRQERVKRLTGRLCVEIDVFPPDNRRRDLDNVLKATLDALQHAGAYEDDSQIDVLVVRRRIKTKGGELHVRLDLLNP